MFVAQTRFLRWGSSVRWSIRICRGWDCGLSHQRRLEGFEDHRDDDTVVRGGIIRIFLDGFGAGRIGEDGDAIWERVIT